MPATIKVPTTFTAVDKFSGVVKKMTGGMKRFSKQSASAVQRLDGKINKTFASIGKVGALIGGLTIGALFQQAVQGNLQFNDSLASVQAITGATGDQLASLEKNALNTAKSTNTLGADVLKAYELVGSAQPLLLKNADALDGVTRSVITLSKASRMDLENSTKSLTDVMNQFNKTGKDSVKVVDVLAAGAKFGAAAIPQISEAIVQFGTVAKQSNVTLMESVAAVEIFASKGIKGAEAGTKLRNVLTTMATAKALPKEALKQLSKFGVNLDIVSDKSRPLNERLAEMSKISADATAMVKVFGKENQGAGAIMLQNIEEFKKMTENVDQNGVAMEQAAAQTSSLSAKLKKIHTAFINTTTATSSGNEKFAFMSKILDGVATNMDTIVSVVGGVLAGFVALKVIVGIIQAISIAQGIYNAVVGAYSAVAVTAALTGSSFAAVVWATLAPILAVIAAIAAIIAIFYYWDEIVAWFSKQWDTFTSFLSSAWGAVVEWFEAFSFVDFFKGIGQAILKFMLLPLTSVLGLLAKLPGSIGEFAGGALETINQFTGSEPANTTPLSNSTQVATQEAITTTQNNVAIDIRDRGNNVENVTQNGGIDMPVTVTNTLAAI